ncbi:glycoside hydrolase family 30 beta sandwich domain-containing protein [Collinsella tanakaei]|uniref:glycoside hydrolase family 30 beta sandwich domain-containing protein n=1 Tax=Collinsella tanakaei TaxID=626935 RepID=UPI001EF545DA|nr:glycoside hydrolase family 30 beta sandwich domain-containing protein [Collinsella tanakaei]
MYDRRTQTLTYNRSHTYLGHFSRFTQPGARIFPTSSYTDRLDTLGVLNPDGTKVLILLNRTTKPKKQPSEKARTPPQPPSPPTASKPACGGRRPKTRPQMNQITSGTEKPKNPSQPPARRPGGTPGRQSIGPTPPRAISRTGGPQAKA